MPSRMAAIGGAGPGRCQTRPHRACGIRLHGRVARHAPDRRLRADPGLPPSHEITETWREARGLRTDDATFTTIRKRIGVAIVQMVTSGLAEAGHTGSLYQGYRLKER